MTTRFLPAEGPPRPDIRGASPKEGHPCRRAGPTRTVVPADARTRREFVSAELHRRRRPHKTPALSGSMKKVRSAPGNHLRKIRSASPEASSYKSVETTKYFNPACSLGGQSLAEWSANLSVGMSPASPPKLIIAGKPSFPSQKLVAQPQRILSTCAVKHPSDHSFPRLSRRMVRFAY